MPGLAKLIPRLVTALVKRTADFSSSEKALTAALPNWTTAAVPKAMPKLPAKFLTLLVSFWVAVSACLKAFLPVNWVAIFMTTDGSTAIISPSQLH